MSPKKQPSRPAEPLKDFAGTDRFRIEGRLGDGGMGVVYRAYDRARDEWVALKTLLSIDPTALYRFKREFRALADVSHPNLVALYELVSDEGRLFFTMELVEGVDLLTYVRDGADPPADLPPSSGTGRSQTESLATKTAITVDETPASGESDGAASNDTVPIGLPGNVQTVDVVSKAPAETVTSGTSPLGSTPSRPQQAGAPGVLRLLRPAIEQLALAVHAIHQSGYLHRDIKPTNVMVTPSGRVVVLDFGVISSMKEHRERYAPTFFGGTPAYLAPELQNERTEATPASDWYAFGTMLYEALVGWRPFREQASGSRLRTLKRYERPTPPSSFRHDVPPDFDRLCHELLAPDPAHRPHGDEVLKRLGLKRPSTGMYQAVHQVGVSKPSGLVGREHQLGQLAQAYGRVADGDGRVVLLRGFSGTGKSVLARQFLGTLTDAVVLEGRCYERESVPYKGLDSVVDTLYGYLLHLGAEDVQSLVVEDLEALTQIFPVLSRVGVFAQALNEREAQPATGVEQRQRAFVAFRTLITRIAVHKPVVIFVDDMQWGDAESAPLLIELMREPAPRVLLLGTYRAEEEHSSAFLAALLTEHEGRASFQGRVQSVDVSLLTDDQAVELAQSLLPSGDAKEAAAIAREAEGNAYFVQELARNADHFVANTAQKMSLDAVILKRAKELELPVQRLLQVVAVAGWQLPQRVVRHATELGSKLRRQIAELRAAHLVRTTGSGKDAQIETYHDRVREALVASLSAEQQRFWHERLADALEKGADPARPEHVYALAQHAYLGEAPGRHSWIFELNLRAGKLAHSSYAYDQAHHYLCQAVEVAERGGIVLDPDVEQLVAQVSAATGRVEQAVIYCRRALIHSKDALQRASLRHDLAKVYVSAMNATAGHREVNAGLRELDRPTTGSGLMDLLRAVWAWRKGRAIERDAKRFGSATGDERAAHTLQLALHQQGALSAFFGLRFINVLKNALRMYKPAALLGLCPAYVQLYMSLGSMSAVRRLPWAERLLARTAELARELDHPPTSARVQVYLSMADHFLGHTVQASKRAESALTKQARWLENADYFTTIADLSWNLLMRGYPDEGWHWIQQGMQRAALSGDSNLVVQGHTYRCYAAPLLTMGGDYIAGRAHLDRFRTTLQDVAQDPWRWAQYLGHLALSLVIDGQLGSTFDETLAQHQALKVRPSRAPLQLCQAFVAGAYGRLWQFQRAAPADRGGRRAQLKRALRALRQALPHETLVGHRLAVEAEFLREEGKMARARMRLLKAAPLLKSADNRWAAAECAITEGRIFQAEGHTARAEELWERGLSFFDSVGWSQRGQRLRMERKPAT